MRPRLVMGEKSKGRTAWSPMLLPFSIFRHNRMSDPHFEAAILLLLYLIIFVPLYSSILHLIICIRIYSVVGYAVWIIFYSEMVFFNFSLLFWSIPLVRVIEERAEALT